jgi:hypothetical protein
MSWRANSKLVEKVQSLVSEQKALQQLVQSKKEQIHAGRSSSPLCESFKSELLYATILSPLGRYGLENNCFNGVWRSKILSQSCHDFIASNSLSEENLFESYFYHRCPHIIAFQQHYQNLKDLIKPSLKKQMKILSYPSGLLGEIFDINSHLRKDISITAVDPDRDTVEVLREEVRQAKLEKQVRVVESLDLSFCKPESFDLIIAPYVILCQPEKKSSYSALFALYKLLKPKGTLLTGFITPSRDTSGCEWVHGHIAKADIDLQQYLIYELMEMKHPITVTTEECKRALKAVGFSAIKVVPDQSNVYPTVLAKK